MFTGIIETIGKVIYLQKEKSNLKIGVETSIAKELKIGQSIAQDGVCLTVDATPLSSGRGVGGEVGCYYITAVKETLDKTNLGSLKKGSIVNLERSLKIGDRLDGHFVQGHVDTKAKIKSITNEKGSWIFAFEAPNLKSQISNLVIEKGSICINGVSLTIVEAKGNAFSVAIIPHTFQKTNFKSLKKGNEVNIEFDILGKHIQKIISNS